MSDLPSIGATIPKLVTICINQLLQEPRKWSNDTKTIRLLPFDLKEMIISQIKSKLSKMERKPPNPRTPKRLFASVDDTIEQDEELPVEEVLMNWCGRMEISDSILLDLENDSLLRGLMTSEEPSLLNQFQIVSLKDSPDNDHKEKTLYSFDSEVLTRVFNSCTQLRTVILRRSADVNNEVVLALRSSPHLQHLDLRGCWEFDENSLISLLQTCNEIKFLSLQDCHQISERTIAAILKYLPCIERVELGMCPKITTSSCIKLISCESLKSLSLKDCKSLNNKSLQLLGSFKKLERLDISSCISVTDKGLSELGASHQLERLIELKLDSNSHFSPIAVLSLVNQLTTLEILHLRSFKIQDLKGKLKMGGIAHVKHLDLTYSNAGSDNDLATFLRRFPNLEILKLALVSIENWNQRYHVDVISHGLPKLKLIDTMDFQSIPDPWNPPFNAKSYPGAPSFPSLETVVTDEPFRIGSKVKFKEFYTNSSETIQDRPLDFGTGVTKFTLNFEQGYYKSSIVDLPLWLRYFPNLEIIQIHGGEFDNASSLTDVISDTINRSPSLRKLVFSKTQFGFNEKELISIFPNLEIRFEMLPYEEICIMDSNIGVMTPEEYEYELYA